MTIFKLLVTFLITLSFAETKTGSGDSKKSTGGTAAPWSSNFPGDGGPAPLKQFTNVCSDAAPGVNLNVAAAVDFKVFAYNGPGPRVPDDSCEMALDPVFGEAFRSFVPKCALNAAQVAGISGSNKFVTGVEATQMGGYTRRHTNIPGSNGQSVHGESWSRHSTGEAVDLESINLKFSDGTSQKIELTSNSNNNDFYDAFRNCWDTALDGLPATKGCMCSIACNGKHKPSNGLHNNHMHISFKCSKHPPARVAGC